MLAKQHVLRSHNILLDKIRSPESQRIHERASGDNYIYANKYVYIELTLIRHGSIHGLEGGGFVASAIEPYDVVRVNQYQDGA